MEMCLTGRMMGAEEAERSGLVAKVVPAADLLDEALKTAEAIAAMAPLAAIATKEMVNAAFEMPLAQGINFERRLFHGLFGTEDQKEGMAAFVEKRPGNWRNPPLGMAKRRTSGGLRWQEHELGWHAKIAFIGLGHMGGGMAPNLAKAGHEVRAFDLSEEALAARRRARLHARRVAPRRCQGRRRVVTMLPAGKHVADVYRDRRASAQRAQVRDPDRLLDHRRRHRARRSRAKPRRQGFTMVDAPVSGGIAAAEGGTLTFMVGGSDEGFERPAEYPREDGQGGDPRRRRRRRPGGQDLQQHAARRDDGRDLRGVRAGAEARPRPADLLRHFVQGVGPELVDDELLPGPRRRPETPADRDYEGGFAAALMLKDLKLAMERRRASAPTRRWAARPRSSTSASSTAAAGQGFLGIIKMIDDSWLGSRA
jgi:3-hydroxyisobutyrate dehydrogenase